MNVEDVTKQLARNITTQSQDLVLFVGSLEKMEFFKNCPPLEKTRLKNITNDICDSSLVLGSCLNVLF
jgi:hypothetical protein